MAFPLFLSAAEPLAPSQATNTYEWRDKHDPEGTGKFYLGREIAQVMGHQGADWLERAERNAQEQPDRLVSELRLKPGDVVADIGAGTGYFTRRLARRVLPGGKVFAVDIQLDMLKLLTNGLARLNITNVVPVLGTAKDPLLPEGGIDLVLMVDVYHEFNFPREMLQGLCASLKPGGRLVFVEYRAEDPRVPIKAVHKMTAAQVRKEMTSVPLQWLETIEVLPWQHIIVFKKSPDGRK